jgi:hypothetical protein
LGVVIDHGRTLVIETAANQGNPSMEGKIVFGIDDGEHAYYLKVRTAGSGAQPCAAAASAAGDHGRRRRRVCLPRHGRVGVRARRAPRFHPTRKPVKNPFIERFNGKLSDECLNGHVFASVIRQPTHS